MDNYSNNAQQQGSKKRWLFLGLGLAVTGVLSFFGFQYWQENHRKSKTAEKKAPDFKPEKQKPDQKKTLKKEPVKPAAKPPQAKATQPKSNAKNKTSTNTKGTAKKGINATLVAKGLYAAMLAKGFNTALTLLQTIKSTADYTAVNKVFSTFFLNGVHQTLVNGMLNSFKTKEQQQAIRLTFLAMGLKYDGNKWSLSGLENNPLIITTVPTRVWKDPRTSVSVPANMVLGRELERRKNFSMFASDNQYFLVESGHVNYYKK